MYECTTANIRIIVKPQFLEGQSRPDEEHYVWAYTIKIENQGQDTVTLRSRYWKITDGRGRIQEVRGAGVVGEQPTLSPGQSFEYTSGAPLPTPSGFMTGSYQMQASDGHLFNVEIPTFSLELAPRPAANALSIKDAILPMTGQTLSTREMLERLVAFDTTSRDGNIPLIEFVEAYLDGWGIPHLRVDYEAGKKTNLYATIGPDEPGGIVLSGHTDVVPVDGQPWATDPFSVVEHDGKLYGRGTCDMKGFIAVALAMVPEFKRRSLRMPIHLALSCDEEVGCRGVRPLVAYMQKHLPKPAVVLVGEPTLMKVVNAHKGAHTFTTEVTGHEAHSSCTHLGVNAIMTAAELITELNRTRQDLIKRGDRSGRFDPPYTTVHVGLIEGGTAKNIIPRHCSFTWETRLLPDDDPREVPDRFDAAALAIEPEMKRISPEAGIKTTFVNSVPGLAPEENSPAERLALHLAEANGLEAVSYATEAGLFQQIGIPSVICGPGSIEQAHKPDEYVEVSELRKCESFMRRLADYCMG